MKEFHFDAFLAYGGLIDIFTNGAFGPNFSMEQKDDRAWIELIAYLNDVLIETGYLKPTIMFARMTAEENLGTRIYKRLSPESCIRRPDYL